MAFSVTAVTLPGQFLVTSIFLYFYLSPTFLSLLLVSNNYFLAAASFLRRWLTSQSINSPHVMELEDSLPYSQQP
jgi:hypothetical protein